MKETKVITGGITGNEYNKDQIFDPMSYVRMKREPLYNNKRELVIPVRNRKSPQFRRVLGTRYRKRIGVSQADPTHGKVVAWLKRKLQANRLQVEISVKSSGTSGHNDYGRKLIFCSGAATQYGWLSENECRILFELGKYIVPDIVGRDIEVATPSYGHETVIIEVIQTHFPDQETFFRLLFLSSFGYLVIFYFVSPEKYSSKFNHFDIDEGIMKLRPAYYLAQGSVFKYGEEWRRLKDQTDASWYSYLTNSYFKYAMENK